MVKVNAADDGHRAHIQGGSDLPGVVVIEQVLAGAPARELSRAHAQKLRRGDIAVETFGLFELIKPTGRRLDQLHIQASRVIGERR
ncbi:hypothetical protein PkP19E3_34500 (plasmid) [Pseudomonas koreensis]|nr:hypothetical protein PkP19E3_34500 [Pseudomonas koreensis]